MHWSKAPCPYASDKWEATSGTLFVKNNSGYSGLPTREDKSVCESQSATNSYTFRLNTKDKSFKDSSTSFDYNLTSHGLAGNGENSYDGIHVWIRYQTQYSLYVASIGRWDGEFVIKKKVPLEVAHCSNPANDGCYYDISPQVFRKDLVTNNTWRHAEVKITDDLNGKPNIKVLIDGKLVLKGIDNGQNGPIIKSGGSGIRGDNTEFYFKNFNITAETPN